MGLFGGVKISSAQSSGYSISGDGDFKPRTKVKFAPKAFDLSNPYDIAGLGVICFAAYYLYKRYKK